MLKVVKINAQGFVKVANRDFAPPYHAGNFQKNFKEFRRGLPNFAPLSFPRFLARCAPVSMAEPAVFLKPNFKRSLYAAADRVLASRSLRSSRAATWFAACRNPIKILLLERTVLSGEPFFAVLNEGLYIFRRKRYGNPAPRRGHRTDQRNARSFHRVNSLPVYRHASPRVLRRNMQPC